MNVTKLIYILLVLCWSCGSRQAPKNGLIAPEERDGRYLFRVANQQLMVDPALGGRITSLTIDGRNFLTGADVNDFNWGSTFWPSPQRVWKWPPPAALDNEPYTVRSTGPALKLQSQLDPQTGLVVTKEISASNDPTHYTIRYTLTNAAEEAQGVAPWEVTRVHTGGVAFFPTGQGDMWGGLLPLTTVSDGIAWFTYAAEKLPTKGDRQLYTDGAEGWMAYLDGRTVLIKKFTDVPLAKNAPSEGEIELFASEVKSGEGYVEIEHQGAYEILAPGDSLTWEVVWYLRELPSEVEGTPGNNLLVDYVRTVIK